MSPELKAALEVIRKNRGPLEAICILLPGPSLKLEFLELIKAWPKHSGNDKFPIPHPSSTARDAFIAADDMWAGTYGQNRLEAVNWLLGKTTDVAPQKAAAPIKVYGIPKL